MHTIVWVSDKARVDDSLRKALEALFPHCRIEVIHINPRVEADSSVAACPARGA